MTDNAKINQFLIKIDRFCGWALFLLMFLYFISGYGITKGIIDPVLAKSLHERWLPFPTFIAFILHSAINLKFLLIRKGIKDEVWLNVYIAVLGLVFFTLFMYLYLL